MIEISKELISANETSVTAFSQAYIEADIIVPDIKPDIAKVLQVDADVVITNKFCSADRVTVEGKVNLNILYIGEDGCIKCILSSQRLSHLMDVKNSVEGMNIELQTDVENVDFNIMNSRKLFIKVLVGLDVSLSMPKHVHVTKEIMGDIPFEMLSRKIKPYSVVCRCCQDISICEKLELPSVKPSINNILKLDVKVTNKEVKLVNNKVIVKGNLCVTTLYLGDNEDNDIQYLENEVPFTEIIEAPGAEEDMRANIAFCTKDVNYEVDEDSDGDCRVIIIQCKLEATVKVCNEINVDIVEDAYSVEYPVLIAKKTAKINRLVGECSTQLTLKDIASMPMETPEIMQVYNIIAKPYIATTKMEYNKVLVEGVIDTYILYLSKNRQYPIHTHKHEQKFSQYIEIDGAREDMLCDVDIDIEHISFNINNEHEVEMRCTICICTKVTAIDQIEYINEISKMEEEITQIKPACCIKIYFVKKNDRLWDVAKKYRTTVKNIMDANDIISESDLIYGKQLMIP